MQQKVLLKKGETRKKKKQYVRKSLSRTDKRIQVMTMTPPPNALNKQTIAYHRAVRRQIENEFYKDNLSSVHVLSHRRKQSMKLRERGVVSDAWTVFLGDSDPQSSFDVVKFFQCFPKIIDKIKELRDEINVRVISTTDPLKLQEKARDKILTEFEGYWQTKLVTLEPYGLNGKDEWARMRNNNKRKSFLRY